ncbi:hypothetical protein CERSUDRAFT_84473 [Gelatoporia subvermispora B]|uniref:Uncharacterized protein n=1 Tax=Ceriporiopsis subvermispora (strain B) TaxID=914234 RepID=M2RD51_CERS8|nr:hypothetical protein CERSUDRAFT_84473 [Gelatoporia subvermispora B]
MLDAKAISACLRDRRSRRITCDCSLLKPRPSPRSLLSGATRPVTTTRQPIQYQNARLSDDGIIGSSRGGRKGVLRDLDATNVKVGRRDAYGSSVEGLSCPHPASSGKLDHNLAIASQFRPDNFVSSGMIA